MSIRTVHCTQLKGRGQTLAPPPGDSREWTPSGGETSLETFIARQEPWLRGDALTIEVMEKSDTRYRYNVTRCKYAEMYRDMGLGEIGHLLSCQRDGTFCEGYDDRIKLKRTQTIMQGATHCDFDYTFEKEQD